MSAFTIIEVMLTQLAAGLLAGMMLVPRRETGPGFFLTGSLIVAGLLAIILGSHLAGLTRVPGWYLGILAGSMALAVSHAWMSRLENRQVGWAMRAAPFVLAIASVVAVATAVAQGVHLAGGAKSLTPVSLGLNFLAGTAVLGLTALSLFFGHWYLVLHGLSFAPLKRVILLTAGALVFRAVLLGVGAAGSWSLWQELHYKAGGDAFTLLAAVARVGAGFGVAAAFLVMAWGCLKVDNNQSATGILYAMTVMVLIGEAAGRYFLVTMGIPL